MLSIEGKFWFWKKKVLKENECICVYVEKKLMYDHFKSLDMLNAKNKNT